MTRLLAILSLPLLLSACLDDSTEDAIPSGDAQGLAAELQGPRGFDIAPTADDTGSVAYASAVSLRDESRSDLELSVLGGTVEVRAAGEQLFIQELEIAVGDIEVPSTIIEPSGLDLTGITLAISMPTTVNALWSADGTRVTTTQPLDLVVEWGTRLPNGDVHPLSPLHLDRLPLVLEVEQTRSGLSTRIVIDYQGTFWQWLETFELADLSADVRGAATY